LPVTAHSFLICIEAASAMTRLDDLPDELVHVVLDYVGVRGWCRCAQVSQRLLKLLASPRGWNHVLLHH